MIEINVEMDLSDVNKIAKRQIPFILSKTLTDLAKEATKENRKHAGEEYTIRRPWVMNGFRSQGARKDFLKALVFHRDTYMHKHERGDLVRSKAGKFNAIPQVKSRLRRASVELQKPNTFVQGRGIVRRKRGARTYELLFKLSDEARYLPTLKMQEIAQEVVNRKADELLDKHWANVIG